MQYNGTIRNGNIILHGAPVLPEGASVQVNVLRVDSSGTEPKNEELRSLSATLLKHAGTVTGLPPDLSRNHEHYLYGTPKDDE